jgi:hypothetical protein
MPLEMLTPSTAAVAVPSGSMRYSVPAPGVSS